METETRGRWKTALLAVLCGVLAVIAIAMGATIFLLYRGGAFQHDVFFQNTYINEIDCGGMTVEEAVAAITVNKDDYVLTIRERNGTEETITGSEVAMKQVPETSEVQALLDEQSEAVLGLLPQVFQASQNTVSLTQVYDEELAQEVIEALSCLDPDSMEAPVDASIQQNDDNTFQMVNAVAGTTLDTDAAKTAIEEALAAFQTELDLEEAGVYTNPSVTEEDEDLVAELNQLQTFTQTQITFECPNTTVVFDKDAIVDCLEKNEEGQWVVNEDKVHDWVENVLAAAADTYKKPHEFTKHDGTTITLDGGDYGWRVSRDDTTAVLMDYIAQGAVATVQPEWGRTAKSYSSNDLGGTYVEISISEQKVWLYKDGVCTLTTDCVTGCVSKGYDTPSGGIWKVKYKESPAVLGTYEVQGYESHVTYWMPFNGGVGLHDADGWRSSYGGSIYKTNGSHGCVNLPLSAAKTIYETISTGTAIVVY